MLGTPCYFFVEEVCQADADAKVILNTRDADEWIQWMKRTLFAAFGWPSRKILRYRDAFGCRVWLDHVTLTWKVYDKEVKGKQAFWKHPRTWWVDFQAESLGAYTESEDADAEIDLEKKIVPSDRLLVYQISDSWHRLVTFLGLKEVVAEPAYRGMEGMCSQKYCHGWSLHGRHR